MAKLDPKHVAHIDFTLEYLLEGLRDVNVILEDVVANQITKVFGRSGPEIEAMYGDYDTSLIPETPNLRYQTDLQKLYNDATSSIQTQLDSKVNAGDFKTIEGQSIIGVGNIDLNKSDVGLGNVDNTSDANKPISIATQAALDLKEDKINKGAANGYAPLDNNAKVPLIHINDALIGNVNFQGLWNQVTNVPNLDIVSPKGHYYICSGLTETIRYGLTFNTGDWIISDGTSWNKVDNTDSVSSVFGRTGNVSSSNGDYTASQITNVPSGNISSLNVQAALNELDAEKAIDANVVHKTGNEIINGQKSFNSAAGLAAIVVSNDYSLGMNIISSSIGATGLYLTHSNTGNNILASQTGGGDNFKANHTGTGFNYVGQNNNVTTFTVDKLGVVTASKYVVPGGTSSQFLKANGDIDSTVYAIDANVLHKTGDESFTGIKSSTNTGTTSANGISLTNNGTTSNARSLVINNTASGRGQYGFNSSTGQLLYIDNTSTGNAIEVANSGLGRGIQINNQNSGIAIQSVNNSNGFGLLVANNSTGVGIRIDNSTAATGLPFVIQKNTVTNLSISDLGVVTGTSFIKSGATTSNILLAGGSDIPQSTFVPSTRTININGVTQDLSANRQYRAGLSNTGALTYAGATMASATTINVGAVTGIITDNETTPGTPSYQLVSYAGGTGLTVPTIGSGTGTYVLLNNAGTLVFQNTFPTSAQRKTMIYLSKISHPNLTSISFVLDEVDFVTSPLQQHRDFFQVIGYMNQGIVATGNAGLTINTSNGSILGDGINFVTDRANPNFITIATGAPRNFLLLNQSGAVGSFVTTIDPVNYDVAGVTTPVGGGTNNTTIQYLYYAPGVGFAIQRGQTVYSSLLDAVAAVGRESFVVRANLVNNSILIAAIVLRHTTTNMNDTAFVRILPADKFGQIGGASSGISVTSLQTAYNNSLIPQITTSTALGAVTLRNGGAADSSHVFDIQNLAGTTTFGVTGNGSVGINVTNPTLARLHIFTNQISRGIHVESNLTPTAGVTMVQGIGFSQINTAASQPSYCVNAYNVNPDSALGLVSQVAQDADAGTLPANVIQVNKWDNAGGGIGGKLITRPILGVYNYATQYFQVAASGNVVIGTDSATPINKFEVKLTSADGTVASNGVAFHDAATNRQQIAFGVNTANLYSWIQSTQVSIGYKTLALNPNGGNVGIGLTNPSQKLEVREVANVTGFTVSNANDFNSNINIIANVGKLSQLLFQKYVAGAAKFRWGIRSESDAESGSNVGSDLRIAAYDDNGSFLFDTFYIQRNNGAIRVVQTPTTSASTYDLVTRNISTGFLEKVSSSGTFIQNQITSPQAGNFWISGAGAIGADTSTNANLSINGAAGNNRSIFLKTASVFRWGIRTDNIAESGSNAGSNFRIANYDDTGNFISEALTIRRSDGFVSVGSAAPLSKFEVRNGDIAISTSNSSGTFASPTSRRLKVFNYLNSESGYIDFLDRISSNNSTKLTIGLKNNGGVLTEVFALDGLEAVSPSSTNLLVLKRTALSLLKDGIRVDRDPTLLSSAIFNAFGGAANIISNSGVTSTFPSITFNTSDNTTTTELVRILGNGNVGIGTTVPVGKLNISIGLTNTYDVVNQVDGSISFCNPGTGAIPTIVGKSSSNRGLFLIGTSIEANSQPDMELNIRRSDNLDFTTFTSTGFRLSRLSTTLIDVLRNGNTSIGVLPSNYGKLELNNQSLGTQTLSFYTNDGTANNRAFIQHITTLTSQRVNFTSAFTTGSALSNWTFETGNVGIGTTAPITKLQVNSTAQTAGGTTPSGALSITDTATSALGLNLGVDAVNSHAFIQARHNTTATYYNLALNSAGGNVGIGTTAPTAKLHIVASTTLAAAMRLTVGSAPTTPNDGDIWLESNTLTGLKIRIAGVTRTVTLT